MSTQGDIDIRETAEWIEALEGVVANEGPARAHYLIETLIAARVEENPPGELPDEGAAVA